MSFIVFILVNAVTYLQPAAFDPSLAQTYQTIIIICALLAIPAMVKQLSPPELATQPTTFLILVFFATIPLSHLADNFFIYDARMGAFDFFKVLLYYLLFVGLVTSLGRLRIFFGCVVLFTVLLSSASLLQYYHVIEIPVLKQLEVGMFDEDTMSMVDEYRLRSIGMFHDPNDFATVLSSAMLICLYFATEPKSESRVVWWLPLGVLGWAFALTGSRGGLLAMLAGLGTLGYTRIGAKKTIALGLLCLPALILVVGGRATELDTGNETAQQRVQLWSDALVACRAQPFFGVGYGDFQEKVGNHYVCHNSFLHAFTELGAVGGAAFLGAFVYAIWTLYRLRLQPIRDPDLRRLCPFMLAIVVSYAVGLMSLSRCYVTSPYMILGLATTYLNLAAKHTPMRFPQVSSRMIVPLTAAAVGFMTLMYVFVRISVMRSGG